MNTDEFVQVALRDLRIGLFVDLDVGWMAHPFPSGRFKIAHERQIAILKGLGVTHIRCVPAKSDPAETPVTAASAADPTQRRAVPDAIKEQQQREHRAMVRAAQQHDLAVCQRRFGEAAQHYRDSLDLLPAKPQAAAQLAQQLIQGMLTEMLGQGDAAIRLLTESAGDKSALHPLNVTVLSMLLGRAMDLPESELLELGLAAMLHDIGKLQLPDRVRRLEDNFSMAEVKVYQGHVAHGVDLARAMGLAPGAIQAIAQHHELVDGSGFPLHLRQDALSPAARILSLVNRYDGLCNPLRPNAAVTPHEALASIFGQQKTRFDGPTLSAFIRMLGVYPPGSVVQLNDERHAMVVRVNAGRPLKPSVIVHEPRVPRHEALIVDLDHLPNASIRRSLKPASLPPAALEYLQPRQRMCYFFEAAANAASLAQSA